MKLILGSSFRGGILVLGWSVIHTKILQRNKLESYQWISEQICSLSFVIITIFIYIIETTNRLNVTMNLYLC